MNILQIETINIILEDVIQSQNPFEGDVDKALAKQVDKVQTLSLAGTKMLVTRSLYSVIMALNDQSCCGIRLLLLVN